MLKHLLTKKDGEIFVNAAGGDSYEIVRRRAARVALKENKTVNYQLINKKEYLPLSAVEARRIMTPTAWVEELRDYLSDPLSRKELRQLTPKIRKEIVAEIKRQRTRLHKECLEMDREIRKITKMLNS